MLGDPAANTPITAALAARRLGIRYGADNWALRAVDLDIPAGSITALVGPNGAGKSTLLKAWVGFEQPTEGAVYVCGVDPWVDRRSAVSNTGYISQSPALYRDLSADDHLALAKTLRPSFDRGEATRRLAQLDIPGSARPTELSGGQQAQLGLAIALGTRAPVLLLDEPLASLDPLARREFLAVLGEAVRADGSTVVLSSHIITDIEAACDRVVVLGGGQLLLDMSINDAIASHVVGASREGMDPRRFIAAFAGPAGEPLVLSRKDGAVRNRTERSPSLDEVVVGFLSAGRSTDIAKWT